MLSANNQPRIWVIDDEQDVVDSLRYFLEDAEISFRGFVDPKRAMEALDGEDEPDLVILDLHMPGLSGVDVIRQLRARPASATTPVIVVTAYASESSTLNALKAGADDVLQKPLTTTELLARINGQLARSDRLSELLRQNQDLKLVTELARVLSQETELPDILRTLVDGLRTAIAVDLAAIYLVHTESGALFRALPGASSVPDGTVAQTLDLRHLPAVASRLQSGASAWLDANETSKLLDAMGGQGPLGVDSSAVVIPMLERGALAGAIVLAANRQQVGVSPREQFITSIIANYAAIAVHRAELFLTLRGEHRALDETNRELAKTRDFLENVILSSPDAIVASNPAGQIVLYNRAAERIHGWSRDEVLGSNVRRLYPPGGAERIMRNLRSSEHGGPGRLEPVREIVVDSDGREIPVEISAAIIYEDDREAGTVGIFTDLRVRLRMESQLQEVTENLERSRRRAVAAELAGAAAHELNQPLTSLLGYAELLQQTVEDGSDQRRAVDIVHREARRITEIVKKIGQITDYQTKEYVGGTRIVDLDKASEVYDDAEESDPHLNRDESDA